MAEGITEKKRKGVIQCTWGEKSKLERNLIIILIVIIALFVALLLYVIIRPAVMRRRCISKNCLIAASDIISRVNPEIDPCNFDLKFACANSKRHPEPSVKQIIEEELLEILQEEVRDDDHFLLKAQKRLFQSCLEDQNDNVTVINDTIVDLGWPIVIGYQWRDQNFDWQQLVFKLRKNGFPFEMILQVKVVKEGPTYTVKVSPPHLENITESVKLYKNYMADVAAFFGAETKRAETEMEKVFYFAQHLKKMSDFHPGSVSTTVRNYLEDNADLDWLNYINNILYPVNQLSPDDYVQFPTKAFTDELHNLLYRTPKRVIANYIIWSALETSIPFGPRTLREMKLPYECQTKTEQMTREVLCKQTVESFLPDPSHIVYARKYLSKICRAKIVELFHSVRKEFVDTLNETSWLDEQSRNRSISILEGLGVVIGIAGDYFNDSNFVKDSWPGYRGVSPQKIGDNASFLQMVLTESYRYHNNQFYKVHQNGHMDPHVAVTATYPIVDLETNTLTLPFGILQPEMFSEDRPMYLNYGILGKAIATALGEIIIQNGNDDDENSTWGGFYEKGKCLINTNEQDDDSTREVIAEYTGMQVAHSAYKKWLKRNKTEGQLPGISYTPDQLFWISSINCSKFKVEETWTLLRNSIDFDKDFNCPMNPSKKCKIF